MAEEVQAIEVEVKTVSAPLDDLAKLVQEKFTEARTIVGITKPTGRSPMMRIEESIPVI